MMIFKSKQKSEDKSMWQKPIYSRKCQVPGSKN